MDLKTLNTILPIVPLEATEIIIKGRDTNEVFFCMPKEWKPEGDRVKPAPPGLYYKQGLKRWRAL